MGIVSGCVTQEMSPKFEDEVRLKWWATKETLTGSCSSMGSVLALVTMPTTGLVPVKCLGNGMGKPAGISRCTHTRTHGDLYPLPGGFTCQK